MLILIVFVCIPAYL